MVEPPLELSLFQDSEKRPLVVERPGPDVPDATDASSRVENCRSLLNSRCSAHFFLEAIGLLLPENVVRGARWCVERLGGVGLVGGGDLFSGQTWATRGIVTLQLDGFSRCHSSPFSFSQNLLSDLRKRTVLILCCLPKAHFLPSFGCLDQRKWDSRSSPARLLSRAPLCFPLGRMDSAEQRTR